MTIAAAALATPGLNGLGRRLIDVSVRKLLVRRKLNPFTVVLGTERAEALSFEDLRRVVMAVAAKGISLQRFKGLGEMNADQLRETTMDPELRTLLQISVEEAAEADSVMSILMGDDVPLRKQFITQNAKDVRFLDI